MTIMNCYLTSVAISLFGEQLLDLLGKVSLGTPDQADDGENHEHGDEAKPEGLLQHAL